MCDCCDNDDQLPECEGCNCCRDCCLCEASDCDCDCCQSRRPEVDEDWDEDFGGYPDEEPGRWARHCRAMSRAREEGVD